jgi:hypothetical protein
MRNSKVSYAALVEGWQMELELCRILRMRSEEDAGLATLKPS